MNAVAVFNIPRNRMFMPGNKFFKDLMIVPDAVITAALIEGISQ